MKAVRTSLFMELLEFRSDSRFFGVIRGSNAAHLSLIPYDVGTILPYSSYLLRVNNDMPRTNSGSVDEINQIAIVEPMTRTIAWEVQGLESFHTCQWELQLAPGRHKQIGWPLASHLDTITHQWRQHDKDNYRQHTRDIPLVTLMTLAQAAHDIVIGLGPWSSGWGCQPVSARMFAKFFWKTTRAVESPSR